MKYTITIKWSEEDNCFVVYLPEFECLVSQPVTHGNTYAEALKSAEELLEILIEKYQEEGNLPALN